MTQAADNPSKRVEIYSYLAVFAVALVVRAIYMLEMRHSALFDVLMADGYAYDRWARQIAGGDWYGNEVFYQAPLYPYFLGAIYSLLGHQVMAARIVQALVGCVSCVLLVRVGERFFSRRIGVAAGLIFAVYGPAVFFDLTFQKPVLSVFFTALLLLLIATSMDKPRGWRMTAIGVVLGLFALTRENALVLTPVVGLWVMLYFRDIAWPKRCAWLALTALGMVMVLAPVGLRNRDIGGTFLITTAQMGPNFYIGNNPNADGEYQPLRPRRGDARVERQDARELAEQALGRELSAAEVSRYWMKQSLDYIAAQPLDWLGLMGKKAALIVNAHEVVDSEAIEAAMEDSTALTVLGRCAHFGVVGPLAVLGLVVTWRDRRQLWVLMLFALSLAAGTALFYILARYRMPMVVVAVLFAAAAVVYLFEKRGAIGWRRAVLVLIAAIAMNWPMGNAQMSRATTWMNVGLTYLYIANYDRAEENFQRVLDIYPWLPRAHRHLGIVDRARGDLDKAIEHYIQTLRIAPDSANAHNELGELMALTGRFDLALQSWRTALRFDANHPMARVNLSWLDARSLPPQDAVANCDRAIGIARIAMKADLIPLIDEARQAYLKKLNQEE